MSDITKIEGLKGSEVNLKIHEHFGKVTAKVAGLSGDSAKIIFTSFGSAYTMIVPTAWLHTKSTEGKAIDLKQGAEVIANIEAADVWSRKVKVLDLNSVGLLVEAGNRTRFFTWDRVKNLDVPREATPGQKKAFGKAKAPVAKAPAAKAPAGRLAKLPMKVPGRRAA